MKFFNRLIEKGRKKVGWLLILYLVSAVFGVYSLNALDPPEAAQAAQPVVLTFTASTDATYKVTLKWTNTSIGEASTMPSGYLSYDIYKDKVKIASIDGDLTVKDGTYSTKETATEAKTNHEYYVVGLVSNTKGGPASLSMPSNTVTVTPSNFLPTEEKTSDLIAAPQLTAEAKDKKVTLNWTKTTFAGCKGILNYHIYRDGAVIVSTTSADVTSYTDQLSAEDAKKEHTYNVTSACSQTADGKAIESAKSNTVQYNKNGTITNPDTATGDNKLFLRDALILGGSDPNSGWVTTCWKVMLGLANMALILALLALAAVNILHIQYDTYQIKKVLPVLIIGVILANFSLLITRMLLDVSNIATLLFTDGKTPSDFAKELADGAGKQIKSDLTGLAGLGMLFLQFLFALYLAVAFLLLGFMFYLRYVVIIICAIVAPLAFVAMAFPPTQSFFKQWFSWLTKYIFMKPIVFLMLWFALKIKNSGAMDSITGWIILATIIFLAITIPTKLGGTIMGGWMKAGGWATGLGKGGYLRNPLDKYIQSKKDAWKERANLAAERYIPGLAARRMRHDWTMADLQAERKKLRDNAETAHLRKLGAVQGEREAKRLRAAKNLENQKAMNDTLDWQNKERAEERSRNAMIDRKVAAMHNISEQTAIHTAFEKGEDPETKRSWAYSLGSLEGESGELDRAIERVQGDAMLRIAHDKLGLYYTEIPKAVFDVDDEGNVKLDENGKPITVDFKEILKTEIMNKQKAMNFLPKDSDEYKQLNEEVAESTVRAERLIKHMETIKDSKGERVFKDDKIAQLRSFVKDPTLALMDSSRRGFWKGMQRDQINKIAADEADSNTPDVKEADWEGGNNQGSFYFDGKKLVKVDETTGKRPVDPLTGETKIEDNILVRFANGHVARDNFESMNVENALRPDIRTDVNFMRQSETRGKGIMGIYRKRGTLEVGNEAYVLSDGKPVKIQGRHARIAGKGDVAVMDRLAQNSFNELQPPKNQIFLDALKQRMPAEDQKKAVTFLAQEKAYQNWKSVPGNAGKEPDDAGLAKIAADAKGLEKDIKLFEPDETGQIRITSEMLQHVEVDRSLENQTGYGALLLTEIQKAESPNKDLNGQYARIRGVDEKGYQLSTRIITVGDSARAASDTGREGHRAYREDIETTSLADHLKKVEAGFNEDKEKLDARKRAAAERAKEVAKGKAAAGPTPSPEETLSPENPESPAVSEDGED